MDYLDTLKTRKANLLRELDAINILLGQDSLIIHNQPKTDDKRPSTKPEKAHEGITEGKRGNCTTTFIDATPSTEFKRARLTADGDIVS